MSGRGKYVDIKADDWGQFRGYLSVPEGGQKGPGLVLLQEAFGINDNMRQTADMFAELGYVSIVPDLFWRLEPGLELPYADIDKARALAARIDYDLAVKDIFATVRRLKTMDQINGKIGTVGFCMGGRLVFLIAARGSDQLACAVSYYGVKLDLHIHEAPNVKCPIIFHVGDKDPSIPANIIKMIEEAFKDNKDAQVFIYPGAGHGFGSRFRTDGRYQKESADLAQKRTLELLSTNLKV